MVVNSGSFVRAVQLFLVLACMACCLGQEDDSEKIKVSVYYESLCPDSLRFIQEQLAPNWQSISPYVNIQLIPFGKSSSTNQGKNFVCQHGPRECAGNKLQSCALDQLDNDQDKQVSFVSCMMSYFGNAKDHGGGIFLQRLLKWVRSSFYPPKVEISPKQEKCLSNVGLPVSSIERCYSSDLGIKLQLLAEKFTNDISPAFIPTIVYENQFDQALQDASLADFKSVICSQIISKFPEQTACDTSQQTLSL